MTSPSSRQLAVSVIGVGQLGSLHAQAFADDPRTQLSCVYDIDKAKAEALAKKLKTKEASSFEDALEKSQIACIATFDNAHADQVIKALKAGKHVFVEKPLAYSKHELSEIAKAHSQNEKLHLASNLVLRTSEAYVWAKKAITTGELGEIYCIEGDYLYGRLDKITEGWRGKIDNYSVLLGGGIHLLDLILWLTDQTPKSVTSLGSQKGSGQKFVDCVYSLFEFENGLVAKLSANFACTHPHQHVLKIFGTKGTFIVDDQGARIFKTRKDGDKPTLLTQLKTLPTGKSLLIKSFLDGILSNENPKEKMNREIKLIECLLASEESLSRKERVKIS